MSVTASSVSGRLCGQGFLGQLVGHVQRARRSQEARRRDAQHPHAERDLGADRVELRVEDSSVMSRSVMRTGVIRWALQANTVSAESIGRISIVPSSDSASLGSAPCSPDRPAAQARRAAAGCRR